MFCCPGKHCEGTFKTNHGLKLHLCMSKTCSDAANTSIMIPLNGNNDEERLLVDDEETVISDIAFPINVEDEDNSTSSANKVQSVYQSQMHLGVSHSTDTKTEVELLKLLNDSNVPHFLFWRYCPLGKVSPK